MWSLLGWLSATLKNISGSPKEQKPCHSLYTTVHIVNGTTNKLLKMDTYHQSKSHFSLPGKKSVQIWQDLGRSPSITLHVKFRALTCIDYIICIPEVISVENITSRLVAQAFEDGWLSRYPVISRCLYDNGNKFLGLEFIFMLQRNKIKSVP